MEKERGFQGHGWYQAEFIELLIVCLPEKKFWKNSGMNENECLLFYEWS